MTVRGPIGRDGATGAEGRAGTTGRDGGEGHTGQQGIQGEKGARGRSGGRNAAAAFLILMTFSFFGFVRTDQQTTRIESQAKETVKFLRQGCNQLNIVRENQAVFLVQQVRTTDRLLKRRGGLGTLERFRKQVAAQNNQRKRSLEKSRMSVARFPVTGRAYRLDCARAYPFKL